MYWSISRDENPYGRFVRELWGLNISAYRELVVISILGDSLCNIFSPTSKSIVYDYRSVAVVTKSERSEKQAVGSF